MWRPDVPTKEYRAWRRDYEQLNVDLNEFLFRVMEMVIFISAVWIIEDRLKARHGFSWTLMAVTANYCRSKVMLLTLPALERYEVSEAWRHRIYWVLWLVAVAIWIGLLTGLQFVLPVLARGQP
ncbi:hypothetical protein ACFOKF_06015 [Sphingobium rhizovicinum]|uniref:Uncharacterized protein n=1 Tax=Sphingobium rhizovicinum TaxID=432308 RepID=A0ABV7NB86_9SPHN